MYNVWHETNKAAFYWIYAYREPHVTIKIDLDLTGSFHKMFQDSKSSKRYKNRNAFAWQMMIKSGHSVFVICARRWSSRHRWRKEESFSYKPNHEL